jgi:hypothetical protein
MRDVKLGRLQRVDLRDIWASEPGDFTPWLASADNLELLGETIGIDLELEATEKNVGPFRADILCKDATRDAEISAMHAVSMIEFAKRVASMRNPPTTLGSIGVNVLLNHWEGTGVDQHAVLGTEIVPIKTFNPKTGRYETRSETVQTAARHRNEAFFTESYHGGRNECYAYGVSPSADWRDFDLEGAYTTAMAAIRTPDFDGVFQSTDPSDYRADLMGFAHVRFKFPDGTRFPNLPVRCGVRGLVFPMEGETHCCSPEIALALAMGAEITIIYGVIVPWADGVRPFAEVVKMMQAERLNHLKDTLHNLLWKEIGNSLYGKLAQGTMKRRQLDTRAADTVTLPQSRITCPALAAYTTSMVRAILGELLLRIPTRSGHPFRFDSGH